MTNPEVPRLESGSRVGSYEIVARLGAGGMGEVYRARDLKLGRDVALKVLRQEFAKDPDRLGRFEREARSASALNHPNLVHIYQIGQDGPVHFMAMELVEGETLRRVLDDAPLPIEEILTLTKQIVKGLTKAHDAGIVHRDLKPENIMLSRDGYVKLLDFGLAKLMDAPFEVHSEMSTMVQAGTRAGTLIGTVEYMSPEQASGRAADHRSDQFSLGLIVYEMVTGRLAFQKPTAAQTLAAIIERTVEPAPNYNPSCPSDLENLIDRLLAKDPRDRFADTGKILDVLETIQPIRRPPIPPPPVPSEPKVPTAILHPDSVAPNEDESDLDYLENYPPNASSRWSTSRGPEIFYIKKENRVRKVSASKLRRRLQKNRYSGLEMIRQADGESWRPLHESRLFKEEVVNSEESALVARRRELSGYWGHLCTFFGFGIFFFFSTGDVPWWMAFWGIGLLTHTMRVASDLGLTGRLTRWLQQNPEASEPKLEDRAEQEKLPAPVEPSESVLDPAFVAEVSRVRELLGTRGDSSSLVAEVDRIVERMIDIATREADLREQTDASELERLTRTESDAREKLEGTTHQGDRELLQKQLAVVRDRREAIERAERVLSRLGIKRDVAEQQIKRLRLDLTRAEASRARVPELTSRLEDIRHEVDAIEDVEAELGRIPSTERKPEAETD